MKSMDDVKRDMSELYDAVKAGADLQTADSLANIAGKYLKAEQLQLARDIFIAGGGQHLIGVVREPAQIGEGR